MTCAHSVVELITRFWPYAIDIIAEEKGIVDGPKPTFFYGWDSILSSVNNFSPVLRESQALFLYG